jgi:hypothetical protein
MVLLASNPDCAIRTLDHTTLQFFAVFCSSSDFIRLEQEALLFKTADIPYP